MSRADLFAILQRNLQRHFRNTEHCALGFSCSARNNISRGSANGQERNYRREINARGPTKQLYSSFFAVLFPVMEIMDDPRVKVAFRNGEIILELKLSEKIPRF